MNTGPWHRSGGDVIYDMYNDLNITMAINKYCRNSLSAY